MYTQDQYSLVNANEEIIKNMAWEVMEQTDMCRCEKCFMDVCAIALNNLNSHYVTSKRGEVLANAMKATVENKIETVVAVSRAVELVKDSPMHVKEEK